MPKPNEKDPFLVAMGRRIRQLREKHNIAQEEFAALAGLDRSYYGGVERGERNVSALNLARIAATLDVEMGALFPPLAEFKSLSVKEQE